MRGALLLLSRVLYVTATLALLALSFSFILYAGWSMVEVVRGRTAVLSALLSAVGLVIISLAVSDVGRFLLEEELADDRGKQTMTEIRQTLSKFITIIIIATSLEALVFVFETGRSEIEKLIYPVALLSAVALLLCVLGLYQRLAHAAEHERRLDAERGRPEDPEKAADFKRADPQPS